MNKINEDDLSGLGLPDPDSTVTKLFGVSGKEVTEQDRVFAKSVTKSYGYDNSSVHYFVRVGHGELIDPYTVNSSLSKGQLNSVFAYRKVGEQTFSSFLKYLETKNRIHFTRARRLLLSENYK